MKTKEQLQYSILLSKIIDALMECGYKESTATQLARKMLPPRHKLKKDVK
jgi:hypothetical protein